MNLEAVVASISHEVRQPLAAIGSNNGAALRFLGHTPPNLEEVHSALKRIGSDVHRAVEVFDSFCALFGRDDPKQQPIDANELVLGVLQALRGELNDHGVRTRVELDSALPLVIGHSGQLREVIINLVQNAIDAMDAVEYDRRVMQVSTALNGADAIIVAVEDSGPGIDPKKFDSIFDPFVTTKPRGMGLGLAICRMIIERHKGQLSASSAHSRGSVFRIVLPIGRLGVA
jgi:C4-dicarboxylate-specific signal transduction histidine kinase